MSNTAIALTPTQLTVIRQHGSAQNYPAMYRYIANEIASGRIAVAGGRSSDQYYWFDQAARINQNDTTSPAAVYIRAATRYGLQAYGQPTTQEHIQTISNTIGRNVFADIDNRLGLSPFNRQLNQDITAATSVGGMSIGGWGGSFYFWNAEYTHPASSLSMAPSWRSTANRCRCEGLRLRRRGFAGRSSENPSSPRLYQFHSTLRCIYKDRVLKTLEKLAANDSSWRDVA